MKTGFDVKCLLMILIFAATAYSSSRVSVGPVLDVNYMALDNMGGSPGFSVGGYFEYKFNELFAIQSRISRADKKVVEKWGVVYEVDGYLSDPYNQETTYELSFIDVSLLLKVFAKSKNRATLSLLIGPSYSKKLSEVQERDVFERSDFTNEYEKTGTRRRETEYFNTGIFGISVGAQLDIDIPKGDLILFGIFTRGVNHACEKWMTKSDSYVGQVGIGWIFGL